MSTGMTNMLHEGKPSDSALRVAELRAVHQLLDDPVVFQDPLALRILGKQQEARLRANLELFDDPLRRGLRAALAVRGCMAEEDLAMAVDGGVRQFVVLGAGLDTFAYRNVHEPLGLQVYEVDHPATQQWKKTLLRSTDISIPQSVTYVGVDFEHDNIADTLRQAGFRENLPTCFSWLGVTMYLTQQVVFDTLTWIASLPRGSSVTFDYLADPAVLSPIDRHVSALIAATMAERGEPWLSDFNPIGLETRLGGLGFSTVTSRAPEDMNERWLSRRKDGLRVGGGFRMMCATV